MTNDLQSKKIYDQSKQITDLSAKLKFLEMRMDDCKCSADGPVDPTPPPPVDPTPKKANLVKLNIETAK